MTDPAPAAAPFSTASKTARFCHGAAFRLDSVPEMRTLERNLAAVTDRRLALDDGEAHPLRLWTEDVPDEADGPLARRHRDAELRRPLAPLRGPLRTVLLRYDDGRADLVLVAHRARIGRPLLARFARAVLTGEAPTIPPAGPSVDLAELAELAGVVEPRRTWQLPEQTRGFADRRHAADGDGGCGVREFTVSGAATEASPDRLHAVFLGAVGLVLARYGAADRTLLSTAVHSTAERGECAEALTLLPLTVSEETTRQAYLSQVRERLTTSLPWQPDGRPALPDLHRAAHAGVYVADRQEDAYVPHTEPLHPLTLTVDRCPDSRVRGACHYRRDEYEDEAVAGFVRHTLHVVEQLLSGPRTAPLVTVELLDEAERDRVARLGRSRRRADPPALCIHDAVAAHAAEHPDRIGVVGESRAWTYRELDAHADRIAAALQLDGVTPGSRVGLCLEPSPELVATMLGVLRAGGVYVPLHPRYPAARIRQTLLDCEAALVITEPSASYDDVPVRTVDGLLAVGSAGRRPRPPEVRPSQPAYVIYTSGSTGRPKGVVVPHRNVMALVATTRGDFGLSERDVWSFFHSPAFDFSVWEIWGCLLTGGRLVVVPHLVARSPECFHTLLAESGVTVLSQTPSAFTHLIDHDHAQSAGLAVRLVVLGGEPLDPRTLLRWFDRHSEDECQVVNMFGITETTVHVTAQRLRRREALAGSRSVGRAIDGWHVYVVDARGRLLPPGVAGEIWVGGAGVSDGYLNRPELTAERFVPDPHAPGLVYRSGDLGRLLPDGRLEHLGRLDDQVKLRGYRIEPGEIRAALLADPAVTAAAVVFRPGTSPDDARLDAYVVPDDPGTASGTEVRQRAARRLPEHLLPASVTVVAELPLTANGKLDAARLPDPGSVPDQARAPAAGDTEEIVRRAWAAVLRRDVARDDDFFGLGGNSLLAIRLLRALAEQGVRVSSGDLYRHPTVRELTRAVHRNERS